jgi:hypothetical protein
MDGAQPMGDERRSLPESRIALGGTQRAVSATVAASVTRVSVPAASSNPTGASLSVARYQQSVEFATQASEHEVATDGDDSREVDESLFSAVSPDLLTDPSPVSAPAFGPAVTAFSYRSEGAASLTARAPTRPSGSRADDDDDEEASLAPVTFDSGMRSQSSMPSQRVTLVAGSRPSALTSGDPTPGLSAADLIAGPRLTDRIQLSSGGGGGGGGRSLLESGPVGRSTGVATRAHVGFVPSPARTDPAFPDDPAASMDGSRTGVPSSRAPILLGSSRGSEAAAAAAAASMHARAEDTGAGSTASEVPDWVRARLAQAGGPSGLRLRTENVQ